MDDECAEYGLLDKEAVCVSVCMPLFVVAVDVFEIVVSDRVYG